MPEGLPPVSTQDVPHPELVGASLMWLLSIPGLLLSVFLTIIKFRSDHRCDESLLSACQIGALFDCSRVLHSQWAVLLRVPISTYTASFYLVLLGLTSCVLYRPTRFMAAVRPLLLLMASVGLLTAVVLAMYAGWVIGSFCSHCTVLYCVNLTIFLAAVLMHQDGILDGFRDLGRPVSRRGTVAVLGLLALIAMTAVQAVWYLRAASSLHIDERCLVAGDGVRPLPATRLETAATPALEAQIALFIDLSCPLCRDEFRAWKKDVAGSEGRFQLSVYHFPRDSECAPSGFVAINRDAVFNRSCRAAAAIECVDRLAAGKGLDMVESLFALQESDPDGPDFTDAALAAAAQQLGVTVDPQNLQDPFFRCLESKDEYTDVNRTIRQHMQFLEGRLSETPGVLFVFYEQGVPLEQMVLVKGAKQYPDIDKFIREARAEALAHAGGAAS